MLFATYLLRGPAPWLLFGLAMALAHARMNRLKRPRMDLPPDPPLVSMLIPAKDEGQRITACLESVLAQDYPNFTVVAINDRSTDDTGAIIDRVASTSQRLRAVHITNLPPGWLGKCNALATAARDAEGKWLLFVDSDVKLERDALSTVLALAEARGYDAVSMMTRLECHNFWEKLLMPLNAATVSTICTVSLTNNDNRKSIAFANGQFFLIRREVYEAVGGHAAVRDNIVEDVALMRLIKSRGFKCRLFSGQSFASTRMHDTLGKMFQGWARIYSGVTRRRPARLLIAIFFVLISGASAYAALVFGLTRSNARWLMTGAAHLALATLILAVVYAWSGNRKRYALLFPLAAPMLSTIYLNAIRSCFTGRIAWRGTSYTYSPSAARSE
jgi:cellulose synthase/poly-beta-1,6-N-acetylglucosamine synthase-like glycosyltransferase